MKSNFAFHRILFVLNVISPMNVISDETPLRVVMLYDKQKYNDTIGLAFSAAFSKVQKALNYPLESYVSDTKSSTAMVTRAYFQAEKNLKPHLYIGEKLTDLVRTIATLAGSKNRMYISLGGSIEQFAMNRDAFPTFASTGRNTHTMAVLVVKAMKKFHWTRAAIVSALAATYTLRARFIKEAIQTEGMKYILYSHAESNLTEENFNPRKNSVNIMFKHLKTRTCLFVLLMSNKEAQFVLKYAAEIGMMNGKYAFLVHAAVEELGTIIHDHDGFQGILSIDRPVCETSEAWHDFVNLIQEMQHNISNVTTHQPGVWEMNIKYAALMYDAVMMWFTVLQKLSSGKQGPDGRPNLDVIARDGKQFATHFLTLRMYGVSGDVVIRDGMRLANFTLNIIQRGGHTEILKYEEDSGNYKDLDPRNLVWPGGSTIPPKEDECLDGKCGKDFLNKLILIIGCSIAAIVLIAGLAIGLLLLVGRSHEKKAIAKWRIKWSEVQVLENTNISRSNSNERREKKSILPHSGFRASKPEAIYKGMSISIKKINRESVDIFERSIYKELKQILHVKHDNINPFVGVCVDAPNVCVAMVHAEKGSLRDVLDDPQFEIDWQFHMSLAMDIATGMEYLHSTPVGAHGHLTSANCVIDERWVCKITDYGLKLFRCIDKLQKPLFDLLWTAPEILHKKEGDKARIDGTKPGDVYSFGIIVSELLTREVPYHDLLQRGNLEELLAKVKMALEPPFRPTLATVDEHVSTEWIDLTKHCWQIAALKRPTFKTIRTTLSQMYSGKFTNVFERTQMVLEESLERANAELIVEKRRTADILKILVPRTILQGMSDGVGVEPQLVKSVTICQCDTTGLYKATSHLSADEVVDALKSLYQKYDEIIATYGAFEVSTWGSKDSMMLAGGLPVNITTDTQAICAMSLDLMNFVETFSHPFVGPNLLKIRISIHTGPVFTSMIGREIPQFCVYGEAVQTTTNIHAFTKDMTIRISKAARDRLPANSVLQLAGADEVKVNKGKSMKTYFITGKKQPNSPRRKSSTHRKSSTAGGARHRPSLPANQANYTNK